MLYAIAGHGAANPSEVTKTLEALWDDHDSKEQDFWLVMINESVPPTATLEAIWQWANRTNVYYEVLTNKDLAVHPLLAKAEIKHELDVAPITGLVPFLKQVDDAALLALAGTDIDSDTASLVQTALLAEIPVYDLSGQMIQIEFEPEEVPVNETPTEAETKTETPGEVLERIKTEQTTIDESEAEFTEPQADPEPAREVRKSGPRQAAPESEPQPAPQTNDAFTPILPNADEEAMAKMSRADLKELIDKARETATPEQVSRLEASDRRSTVSMIDALMGRPPAPKKLNKNNKNYTGSTSPTPRAAAAPMPSDGSYYFLREISSNGSVSEFPIPSDVARPLINR